MNTIPEEFKIDGKDDDWTRLDKKGKTIKFLQQENERLEKRPNAPSYSDYNKVIDGLEAQIKELEEVLKFAAQECLNTGGDEGEWTTKLYNKINEVLKPQDNKEDNCKHSTYHVEEEIAVVVCTDCDEILGRQSDT